MKIDYNHSENRHSLAGPQAALPILLAGEQINSLLDVGCGTGTWLKAALELGIPEVFGVDGVELSPDKLHVPVNIIRHQDLTRPWNLSKKYDVVICLEVAEHLDRAFAPALLDSLVNHGDLIIFSAACPRQTGQHHVNCQWPDYWQTMFNDRGYVCRDDMRWKIWDDARIEPWYRQNLLVARRDGAVGKEPRIHPVVHPDLKPPSIPDPKPRFEDHVQEIEHGRMPASWYCQVPVLALLRKIRRGLK